MTLATLTACGGGGGTPTPVTPPNPAPSISSLSPDSTPAGGGDFTLTVNGSGFVTTSVVRWNGTNRTTTFLSSTQLTATILAGDIAAEGTAQVTVFNPAPGGGTSAALTFTITAPFFITTTTLPDTTGGKAYDFTLASTGGTPPITWALAATSGPLPTTLTLDSTTGRISGTVDPVGVDTPFLFTVEATDNAGATATRALSITVRAVLPGRNDNVCPLPGTDSPTAISNGTIRASLSPYADIDVYSFQGTSGNLVTIETFATAARLDLDGNPLTRDSFADTVIELLDSSCALLTFNDDIELGVIQDSLIPDFSLPSTGTFFIRVRDFRGDGRPDLIYDLRLFNAN